MIKKVKICSNASCGTVNDEDAKFCLQCGSKLPKKTISIDDRMLRDESAAGQTASYTWEDNSSFSVSDTDDGQDLPVSGSNSTKILMLAAIISVSVATVLTGVAAILSL